MPRRFFEDHVKPNYEAWLAHPDKEYLAKNAVSDMNNMAERVFHYWSGRDNSQIFGKQSARQYREELANRECSDFALIRDIADAHKHVELDRTSKQVTKSDQTKPGNIGWGEGGFGEGKFGGAKQLVVVLDNGSKRALSAILKNVMDMWERLLQRMGL